MEEENHGLQTPAEATTDPKALERAVGSALKNYFTPLRPTSDARVDFYNKFKREAEDYDKEFLDKYDGDLDTTLIFAALFSAVVSAFIIAIQTQLRPDYTQLNYDVLWMMARSGGLNAPPKPSSDSPWTGPDPNLVNVQAILFSSLAASLLAAFVAMLGKQWLSRYSHVDMRGSLIDRSRDRQRKMNGMDSWGFKFVMEGLPLMLQTALLLLGCALSKYLFTIDNLVAWVVVVFTASGSLFYLVIAVVASVSYDCPFQTPLSLFLGNVVRFDSEHGKYLNRSGECFSRMFSRIGWRRRRRPVEPNRRLDGNNHDEDVELQITVGPPEVPLVLFDKGIDWADYVSDSNCIAWMFKRTMDSDVILDIMKFIPEIIWHEGIHTTPLEKLYDTVLECFDHSSGRPVVIPKFRNKAYLSAQALVHLGIQRKCINDQSDEATFNSISGRHLQAIGSTHYRGDSDLESTLGMVDLVFGNGDFQFMRWKEFALTGPHHAWMSRILLFFVWNNPMGGSRLHYEVREFVRHSLGLIPPPPAQIVRDCLYVVDRILNTTFDGDDPHVIDISPQIDRIYERLAGMLKDTMSVPPMTCPPRKPQDSTAPVISTTYTPLVFNQDGSTSVTGPTTSCPPLTSQDTNSTSALEAMRLITPLSNNDIAVESYTLFHLIMQVPVSHAHSKEKWEASRLALHGAYKSDEFSPPVGNPQPILDFLSHHFELVAGGEDHDEPIQSALCALAYASTSATIEVLKNFDPTKSSHFVHGICHVFRRDKPLQLRKAALFFLPLIAEKLFNTHDPIMNDDEMDGLCVDWAFAVDEVWGPDGVGEPALAVLLDMMNSSYWRTHVVTGKWELLKHLTSVPDDSQPLARCLENPDLVDAISAVGNPDAVVLWSKILWLKYEMLTPEVRERLEASAKGARRENVGARPSVVDVGLRKAGGGLWRYDTWRKVSKATILGAKIQSHEAAKDCLESL